MAKRAAPPRPRKTARKTKSAAAPAATRKAAARKAPAPAKRAPAKRAAPKPAAPKRAPAKAAAPKRVAPKRVAPKRAAPKRAPARKPAPAKRAAAPKPARAAAPQRFTVSHLREDDFQPNGLRAYALYRDLGIADATGGLAQAHVIRMVPPVTDEVRQRHLHNVDLQLVYVLKGWMKNEFEGYGVQMMEQGSCWLQPPGIKHTVLDYSDDLEVLELIIPADFETLPAD